MVQGDPRDGFFLGGADFSPDGGQKKAVKAGKPVVAPGQPPPSPGSPPFFRSQARKSSPDAATATATAFAAFSTIFWPPMKKCVECPQSGFHVKVFTAFSPSPALGKQVRKSRRQAIRHFENPRHYSNIGAGGWAYMLNLQKEYMTKPEYKNISDFRTSFTQDEIVAKMIGWLRGPIHPKNIELTHSYFTEDQLIHMTELEVSLEEHLTQLLNAAYEDYSKCGDDVPYYIAIAKEEEIERIDALIKRAFEYTAAFSHELMLGNGCMLEKDEVASDKLGKDYYTIASAEKWTQSKYPISIINYVDPIEMEREYGRFVSRDGGEKGLTEPSSNSLYLTFALLIEAYVEAVPDYEERLKKLKARGQHWQTQEEEDALDKKHLNISALGDYLSRRSILSGTSGRYTGLGQESIKTNIEKALDYKHKIWVDRKTLRRFK